MKVFVSYARKDSEIAERLCDDLKREGIEVWLDKKELLPGQKWKAEISRAIRKSSHFIALLSTHSVSKKGFFQTELKKAMDVFDTLPEQDIYFIPVRLDECEPDHEKLGDIQWADLFPSYEDGLKQILRVLASDNAGNRSSEKPKAESVRTAERELAKKKKKERKYHLRKEPITVSSKDAKTTFGLNRNWRLIEYVKNDFDDNGDGTITDHATGLMWQKSGSETELNFEHAEAYVRELNLNKFAGYEDWRLPTVDELTSLLKLKKQSNDLNIHPIFDSRQSWCRTSDKYETGGEWSIDFDYGYAEWGKPGFEIFVRAVRCCLAPSML